MDERVPHDAEPGAEHSNPPPSPDTPPPTETTTAHENPAPATESPADTTETGPKPGTGAVDSETAADQTEAKSDPGHTEADPAEPGAETEADAGRTGATVVVGARKRPRRAGVVVGRTVVALVSALALLATGVAWYTVERFRADTNTTNALAEVNAGAPGAGVTSTVAPPPANDGADDILLVGDDSRTDASGHPLPASVLSQDLRTTFDAGVNTDTIIVLRIPDNGGRAYAISIPRDTWVPIPGYQDGKINGAYGVTKARKEQQLSGSGLSQSAIEQQANEAGQAALISSVQNLTGIHIDHYAEINLYGFYLLSKAIGGVTVCLKHATSDANSGADFRAGVQTVSGASALAFVRQRDNLPEGDIDRIVRQQVFLAAAAKKILSAGVLTNPNALSGLLNTVHQSLVTDPGLDLLTLAQQAQSLISGNVEFTTIPVVNDNARSPDGQSIVQVDPTAVHEFVTGLITPNTPASTSPTAPTTTAPAAGAPAATTAPATASTSAPTTAPPTTTTPPATSTTTAPTVNAPTAPVSINGVPCVD